MNEARLTAIFRQALNASVSAPLVAGALACGGTTQVSSPGRDGGVSHDARAPEAAADSSCGPQACGCSGGCTPVSTCVDGQLQCSCQCPPPVDAGNDPCHPAYGCGDVNIALSCFDALPPNDGGVLATAECQMLCPSNAYACKIGEPDGGPAALICSLACATGRAFAGMDVPRRGRATTPVATYLAETAYLEAAAVLAFDILGRELVAHGAPDELVVAAKAAKADECRHTRMTRQMARRHGASPARPRATRRSIRPLLEVALENAVEGCVRETFGALVAHHQARHAQDEGIRTTMQTIAVDETRHAALGWAVAAWADSRLDAAGRASVRAARAKAVRELRSSLASKTPKSLEEQVGLPDGASAERMLAVLETQLWA